MNKSLINSIGDARMNWVDGKVGGDPRTIACIILR